MVAISALLSSSLIAMLATSVNAAPSVLESRANDRLALNLYKESGSQSCFNLISDPRFLKGIFRPGKADVNTQCYYETPHNSISIDYVQDPKRKCTGKSIQALSAQFFMNDLKLTYFAKLLRILTRIVSPEQKSLSPIL